LKSIYGISVKSGFMLNFEVKGEDIKLLDLDYMTVVREHNGDLRQVSFPYLYHNNPKDPKGGFALFTPKDKFHEDEILLKIWVEQNLPHPNVSENWDLAAAKNYVAEWIKLFSDRSQMMIKAGTKEELYELVPYLEELEAKQVYIFTDTWREDDFWPINDLNWGLNKKIFPNGIKDLREYSDYLNERGIKIALHYVSGGIGINDPKYIGKKPDRRLAGWGEFALSQTIDAESAEIIVNPDSCEEVPYNVPSHTGGIKFPAGLPRFIDFKYLLIDNEIIKFETLTVLPDGRWKFSGCERGMFTTEADCHNSNIVGKGLILPYGINFVPDNDSDLLEEVADGYAGLINGARVMHTEYDGAEIHCYQPWGYRKFTQLVYQRLDHPVTAHDSSGRAPLSYYHYRLNCVRETVAGDCSWGHINHHAHIQPYSHARMATDAFEANFSLSLGHQGTALGIALPEPMFGESVGMLKTHGDTNRIINTVKKWKKACASMNEDIHNMIEDSFSQAQGLWRKYNHHRVADFTYMINERNGGYELVPTYVLKRESGDIKWQYSQEHGVLSPRQYLRFGQSVTLINPCDEQEPKFILKFLWDVNENGETADVREYVNQVREERGKYDFFQDNNRGTDNINDNRPNLNVLPNIEELSDFGDLKISAEENNALRIKCENPENAEFLDAQIGAKWSIPCDLRMHRAIAVTLMGDNSGSVLVIKAGRRDYAVKIDFAGERTVVIPNGEVAWYDGNWGWRMETKSTRYEMVEEFSVSIGYIPPKTATDILITGISFLKEEVFKKNRITVKLNDGIMELSSNDTVNSGDIIEYDGEKAVLYDANWKFKENMVISSNKFVCNAGENNISVDVEGECNGFVCAQIITQKESYKI
ncbi:MAG: hypothetical protein IKK24_03855, partial [Clostridia bacterium]|nr:hypothetical protein [Clostridia bacterium]